MKLKIKTWIPSVITFMLLFPFRLPISVLLILAFNNIANLAGKVVPEDVMAANVVISKLVYNIILGIWFIWSCEKTIRVILGRKAKSQYESNKEPLNIYWQTIVIALAVLSYIIYDGAATYQIFYSVIGKPI